MSNPRRFGFRRLLALAAFMMLAGGCLLAVDQAQNQTGSNLPPDRKGDHAPAAPRSAADEASVQCLDQMKMIGQAFKTWARDHNGRFPFNVSTNAGGTLEFCARRADGFDGNGVVHLRAISEELGIPSILVCPADTFKHPAESFQGLHGFNVSYLLRSGTNATPTNKEVLALCPVHGHVVLDDGSVRKSKSK